MRSFGAGIIPCPGPLHEWEPDTDSDIARLQAISQVRVLRFEQNEQVFNVYGKTELKDGRVYGLTLVISKASLAILGPL